MKELLKRVEKLESDEDFVVVSGGRLDEKRRVEELEEKQKELEAQLAKEKYRIMHLVRALDASKK